jgi:phosphoadenosine phosphosulfate reductase
VPLDRSEALRLVTRAERELAGADASQILKWADSVLDGRLVVTTSMRDAVLVDIAAKVRSDIDVLFVDTGYHFAETLGLRDAVAAAYPVRLVTVQPGQSVAEQDAACGPDLFRRDPDRCCSLRKVRPLDAMLSLYDGWVTGLRRSESPTRASTRPVQWDERRRVLKVNPLVDWTDDDVDAYVADEGVLINPLVSEGFPSIGCAPCTARVQPGEDVRAGRWPGRAKSECGIHL